MGTIGILMEIERAKKERDEKIIAVKEAINRARQEVAQMLQEKETEAEKVRLQIEATGRAELKAAENEARALMSLGQSYQDNQAVLRYQLELRGLEVAEKLMESAPRPVLVNAQGDGETSVLTTLVVARIWPDILAKGQGNGDQVNLSDVVKNLRQD